MKRICLLLLLPVLLLSGCTGKESDDPIRLLCQAKTVTAAQGAILFSLELTEEGGIFRFSAPELLKELTVVWENGQIHLTYRETETDVGAEAVAALLPLYQAIRAFQVGEPERVYADPPFFRVTLDGSTFLLYDKDGTVLTVHAGGRQYEILSCLP